MKNKMTELEKEIYNCALDVVPKIEPYLKNLDISVNNHEFPFMCNGVVNYLVYNTFEQRFTKIKYNIGIKRGVIMEGMDKSAIFDESNVRTFEIKF